MRSFYTNYMASRDMPQALQSAMQEIRRQTPHPYFWAPFILVGKLTDSTGVN